MVRNKGVGHVEEPQKTVGLADCTVHCGHTRVQELLNAGYTISDFEQITEEPTLASCQLNKNGEPVATLWFFGLKTAIRPESLGDVSIDDIVVENHRARHRQPNTRPLTTKIVWTLLIHAFAAALFAIIFAIPSVFSFFENVTLASDSSQMPLGTFLLALPAIAIAILWGRDLVGQKGVWKKLLLAVWAFVNLGLTLAYVALISMALS